MPLSFCFFAPSLCGAVCDLLFCPSGIFAFFHLHVLLLPVPRIAALFGFFFSDRLCVFDAVLYAFPSVFASVLFDPILPSLLDLLSLAHLRSYWALDHSMFPFSFVSEVVSSCFFFFITSKLCISC